MRRAIVRGSLAALVMTGWALQGCGNGPSSRARTASSASSEDAASFWGKPANGISVGVAINKRQYSTGEKIVCLVYLRNSGATPVNVSDTGTNHVEVLVCNHQKAPYHDTTLRAGLVILNETPPARRTVSLESNQTQNVMCLSILSSDKEEQFAFTFELVDFEDTIGVAPQMSLWDGNYTLLVRLGIEVEGRGRTTVDSSPVSFKIAPAGADGATETRATRGVTHQR